MSAFLRIEREVENRQFGINVAGLLAVRVNLILIDYTRTMVTHRIHVVLDMRRGVRLRVAEDWIDGVPRKQCAVLVITRLVDVFRLAENGRCGRQEPITRVVHIDISRSALKIIDICCSDTADVISMSGDKVRKLRIDGERGRRCSGDPRNLVNCVRQPLHLGFPTAVNTPDSVR